MKKLLLFFVVGAHMSTAQLYSTPNCLSADKTQHIICDIYDNIKNIGFSIPVEESQEITDRGGAPTYGEITPESALALIKELDLKEHDVFFDLGCGIGKFNIIVFLASPVKKSIGVELSQTRYNHAQAAGQKVRTLLGVEKRKFKNRILEFRKDDMLETPLDEATVIYMCSTCFDTETLLKKLTDRFAQLPAGTRIVSLKVLPPHEKIQETKTITLAMTWSKNTAVHFYKVV